MNVVILRFLKRYCLSEELFEEFSHEESPYLGRNPSKEQHARFVPTRPSTEPVLSLSKGSG